MKIAFIINPVAGRNRKKDIVPIIKNKFKNIDYKYIITHTKDIDDARLITMKYLKQDYKIIVAIGGDGTVREVASGIKEMNKGILGIIPMGTGNDLARTLNIPLSPDKALDRILDHNIRNINIAKVEQNKFLNVASIGIDAEIVKNTRIFKGLFKGKLAYTLGVLRTLFIFKPKSVTIKYDDIEKNEKVLLVAVANGNYYGGGMMISPNSKIDDNQLDICIIKNISKIKLLFLFPSVYNGKHGKYKKYVKFISANSLKIYSKEKIFLNVDGDILEKKGLIQFDLYNKNIKVIV
ncbi:diacylglycerol/lipid kinase family protein [Senegalia massiliensis]|uniref:Diacylglycerol kinase family lipid kinase n=1 Tax=Senegalia massiliensis TaxID=1720316 RepID=A0A845R0N1_9CLOT|nr:diacylglycerol kinase family protein [Senegalia massiliensis]NBI08131.1 diacylglycerol kinase family lipid kinase [Senegalia massiliensis]